MQPSKIVPRGAQPYCLAALQDAMECPGTDRLLYVLPPKQGKTTIAALFCKDRGAPDVHQRILYLSPLSRKLEEAKEAFKNVYGEKVSYGRYYGRLYETNCDITFATLQGVLSAITTQQFSKNDFSIVIYEAAHHAHTPLYKQVLNYFTGMRIGMTELVWEQDRGEMLQEFGPILRQFTFPEVYALNWTCSIEGKGYIDQLLAEGKVTVNPLPVEGEATSSPRQITVASSRHRYILQDREETAAILLLEEADRHRYKQVLVYCQNPEQAKRMAELLDGVALCPDIEGYRQNFRKLIDGDVIFGAVCNVLNDGDDRLHPDAVTLYRTSNHPRIILAQLACWTSIDRKRPLHVIDFAETNSEINTLRRLEAELRTASSEVILDKMKGDARTLPEPTTLRTGPIFTFKKVPYVIKSAITEHPVNQATISTWEDPDPSISDRLKLELIIADEGFENTLWTNIRSEMKKRGWLGRYVIYADKHQGFFFWPHGKLDEVLGVLDSFLTARKLMIHYAYLDSREAGEDIRREAVKNYLGLTDTSTTAPVRMSRENFNAAVAKGKPYLVIQGWGDTTQGVVNFLPVNLANEKLAKYMQIVREGRNERGGLIQKTGAWTFLVNSLTTIASVVPIYAPQFVDLGVELVVQELTVAHAMKMIEQVKRDKR